MHYTARGVLWLLICESRADVAITLIVLGWYKNHGAAGENNLLSDNENICYNFHENYSNDSMDYLVSLILVKTLNV